MSAAANAATKPRISALDVQRACSSSARHKVACSHGLGCTRRRRGRADIPEGLRLLPVWLGLLQGAQGGLTRDDLEGGPVNALIDLAGYDFDARELGAHGVDALRRRDEAQEEDLVLRHALAQHHLCGPRHFQEALCCRPAAMPLACLLRMSRGTNGWKLVSLWPGKDEKLKNPPPLESIASRGFS